MKDASTGNATQEILERLSLLEKAVFGKRRGAGPRRQREDLAGPNGESKDTNLSFDMNVLAFMNAYARGMKGPQKFTLLLAYLAKGDVAQRVAPAVLKGHWNKMKAVLGGRFNPAHANRAKAKGWVDSPEHGVYTLSDRWKGCIAKK